MKIRDKILTGNIFVAMSIVAVGFLGVYSAKKVQSEFDVFTQHSLPVMGAIQDIRAAGLRIVSSANEFGLIQAEKTLLLQESTTETNRRGEKIQDSIDLDESAAKEEKELLSDGVEFYHVSMSQYEQSVIKYFPDEHDFLHELKSAGGNLIDLANSLVILTKSRDSAQEILDLKENLEEAEMRFLTQVELIIHHENAEVIEMGQAVRESLTNSQTTLIAISCFVFLAAAFIAIVIARFIASPLKELEQAAHKVAEEDYDVRVEVTSNDEIGNLGNAFNSMIDDIRNSHNEIIAGMREVEEAKDISDLATKELDEKNYELKNVNEELQQQVKLAKDLAADAQRANAAKSEFLANMSHELRTPMNGVFGFIQLLNKTEILPEQKGYLMLMETSCNRLINIINDILDFSKIEANKLELEIANFNLHELITECLELFVGKAKDNNIELIASADNAIPAYLMGDSGRLKQVLVNLIGNAIKFTEQGKISVLVKQCQSKSAKVTDKVEVEFTVKDSGIGVPQEKLTEIFDAFSQVDSSTTRKYGGTGLGLTISSQLVQLMGGKILIESTVGKGATFSFRIVFDRADGEANQLDSDRKISAVEDQTADHLQLNKTMGHILLTEDDPINQTLAAAILEDKNYQVTVANNGEEAINLLRDHNFAAILMDVHMPVMDGVETTKVIREAEIETGKHIPIIAQTAHALKGDKEKFIKAGMDGYVAKPFKAEELVEILEKFIQKS